MNQFLNKIKNSVKSYIKKININEINIYKIGLYKIGLYEVIILFILLFFTYTMPMTMYKFTSSFFGKVVALLAIISATYCNVAYGIVLAGLFMIISELGYLEGFYNTHVNKPDIPSNKVAFITEHCKSKTAKNFDLATIDTEYPNLVFTHGVCDPCEPTCRYNIKPTDESLYDFDQKIKPKDATYIAKAEAEAEPSTIENFESKILGDLKGKYNHNKRKARMLKDGFTGSIVDKAKHYARKFNL
jgi:hypothetical protein